MTFENELSENNAVVREIVTLAGVLEILAALPVRTHMSRHTAALERESTALRALADSPSAARHLCHRALKAITLAERVVHDQLSELLSVADEPRSHSTPIARLADRLGTRRHASPPSPPASAEELDLLRRSSAQLLASLAESRALIAASMAPAPTAPAGHRLLHRRAHAHATR